MSVLTTKSGDLSVIPEVFQQYVIERTAARSALFQSGIVQPVPNLDIPATGGNLVTMPFWQDLDGDDQILDSSTDINVAKVDSSKDQAVLHGRALSYGVTDLAAALAGDDPMGFLADLMADKWNRQWQKLLIQTLAGSLPNVTDNLLDISGLSGDAAVFDGASFVDANQKMGDAKDRIVAMAIHSAVEAHIAKEDQIDTVKDSEGNVLYRAYQGKRLIVDDSMPVAGGVYTSYLFGLGAIGYGEGAPKVPVEIERNALVNGGQEYIVQRRHFVLHPRGIRWTPASGVPAKDTPTNSEMAGTGNWTRAYEAKNIRIVQFKHRIVAA